MFRSLQNIPNSIRFEGVYQIIPTPETPNITVWIKNEINRMFPIITRAITCKKFFGIQWDLAAKCYLSIDVYSRMENIVSHLVGNLNLYISI